MSLKRMPAHLDRRFIGARATHASATQSIPTGTTTVMWIGTVDIDTHGFHDVANNRFVIPNGMSGFYDVLLQVRFDALSGGNRYIGIYKNSTEMAAIQIGANTSAWLHQVVINDLRCDSGVDAIDARVWQDSGSAIPIPANAQSFLQIRYSGKWA